MAVAVAALRAAKDAFVAKQTPENAHSMAQALTRLTSLLGSSPDKDSQAQALSGAVGAKSLYPGPLEVKAHVHNTEHMPKLACSAAVASQQGAVPEVLDCCSVLVQRSAELCAALVALLAVLGSEATQEDFHKADRVPVLADVLQAHTGAQRRDRYRMCYSSG